MASKPKEAQPESEAEESAEDKPAESPKKSFLGRLPLKLILMIVLGLAVLGGGGAGAYLFLHGDGEAHADTAKVKPATFFDLPEVLVNLSNTGSDRTQYLKVRVVLELPNQELMNQIQPVMPRVMDAFQTYLRELRPTDLDGSAGLYRLKEELTRRVNAAIAPSRITAVLFKEIVVQ
jgi:flagellar protein FliL